MEKDKFKQIIVQTIKEKIIIEKPYSWNINKKDNTLCVETETGYKLFSLRNTIDWEVIIDFGAK